MFGVDNAFKIFYKGIRQTSHHFFGAYIVNSFSGRQLMDIDQCL